MIDRCFHCSQLNCARSSPPNSRLPISYYCGGIYSNFHGIFAKTSPLCYATWLFISTVLRFRRNLSRLICRKNNLTNYHVMRCNGCVCPPDSWKSYRSEIANWNLDWTLAYMTLAMFVNLRKSVTSRY